MFGVVRATATGTGLALLQVSLIFISVIKFYLCLGRIGVDNIDGFRILKNNNGLSVLTGIARMHYNSFTYSKLTSNVNYRPTIWF